MGPIGCPETSIRNNHYLLRDNPEKRSSHILECYMCWKRIISIVTDRLWVSELIICRFTSVANHFLIPEHNKTSCLTDTLVHYRIYKNPPPVPVLSNSRWTIEKNLCPFWNSKLYLIFLYFPLFSWQVLTVLNKVGLQGNFISFIILILLYYTMALCRIEVCMVITVLSHHIDNHFVIVTVCNIF